MLLHTSSILIFRLVPLTRVLVIRQFRVLLLKTQALRRTRRPVRFTPHNKEKTNLQLLAKTLIRPLPNGNV